MPQPIETEQETTPWWATRWWMLLVSLTLGLPLLWPEIPPLTDIYGHFARYAIVERIDTSRYLHQWFSVRWHLSGNLGVDLCVALLRGWFGVILATKLILIGMAVLTGSGMLWLARTAHDRLPPTVFFALPLVFGMPFQYGFLNYSLSVALLFPAIALWLHLGRAKRNRLRMFIFVPIGIVIWVTHLSGWALLGLILFAVELASARNDGASMASAFRKACFTCLPLIVPLAIMLLQPGAASTTGLTHWFDWQLKLFFLIAVVRDENRAFDIASAVILYTLVVLGVRGVGFRLEPRLGYAAAAVFGVFLVMPGMIMGSALADMRLLPVALALALLSLAPTELAPRRVTLLAIGALSFLGVRLSVQTLGWARNAALQQAELVVTDHIPRGSRVFVLVTLPCESQWTSRRMDHLGLMAIVRHDAFANGVWDMASSQLTVHRPDAAGFVYAGSQTLFPAECRYDADYNLSHALATVPRSAFDFVWLIDTPRSGWPLDPGLKTVWTGDRGILYAIPHTPTG